MTQEPCIINGQRLHSFWEGGGELHNERQWQGVEQWQSAACCRADAASAQPGARALALCLPSLLAGQRCSPSADLLTGTVYKCMLILHLLLL